MTTADIAGGPPTASAPEPGSKAWESYSGLIDQQLEEQDDIKDSLESRGALVITTSGALATLLFALSALVTDAKGFEPEDVTRFLLILAMVVFAVAAGFGLATNWPRTYRIVEVSSMRELVGSDEYWLEEKWVGEQATSEAKIDIIERDRARNSRKAYWLTAAFTLEVAAIGVLVIALAIEIWP